MKNKAKKKYKKCKNCEGKGNYFYHLTLEELKSLASLGGTTNYDPSYTKTCEKCKGKGRILIRGKNKKLA